MASDINTVVMVGRLTRDVELKYSTSGTAIARFSIANNQSRKNGDQWTEEAHFFDLTLLGRRADALSRYLTKGTQVAVQGTLQQDRWQDKNTGENRSKIAILVNDIQLLGSRNGGGQGGQQGAGFSGGNGNYGSNSGNGNYGNNSGGNGNYGNNSGGNQYSGGGTQMPADDGFEDDIPF